MATEDFVSAQVAEGKQDLATKDEVAKATNAATAKAIEASRAVENLEASIVEVVPAFVGPFRDQIPLAPLPRTLRPAGFTVFELRGDAWSRPIRIDSSCEYAVAFTLLAASADALFTPALRFLDGAKRVIWASDKG